MILRRSLARRPLGPWMLTAGMALATALVGAPPLTTVQDVLYKADGTRFNGTAVVSWKSFESADQSAITMHNLTVKIVDGQLRVQLVPNAGVTPATYYSVKYSSDGKIQFEEAWHVPLSTHALRLRDVRVPAPAAVESPSGPITEADVVGLLTDLNARPVRGPGFAPARAAVISPSGMMEAAVGNPADCVRVDGSSGPCGSGGGGGADPGFIDNESPAGAVDGSNPTFVLSATPVPYASLALYRNGMLMKSGQDYSVADRTITFVAAAAPQPGDTLLASYRRQGTAAPVTYSQVLCSGTGTSTSGTGMVTLGTCDIAAGTLKAGDRVEVVFDYRHTGTQGGFTFQATWGETAIVSRSAAEGESMVSGRIGAAVTDASTQISQQTWGSQLSMAAGMVSAATAADAAVSINFSGSVAAGGDSLTLGQYTVIRYPAPTI